MAQQNQASKIVIPLYTRIIPPPDEVALPIPVAKWEELIARIQGFQPNFRPWAVAYYICFIIGVSAGMFIAPLAVSGLPLWLTMAYATVAVIALTCGVAFVWAERTLCQQQTSQITQLTREMQNLKNEYLDTPSDA